MDGAYCAFHYNKIMLFPYQKGRNEMDFIELLSPIENSTPKHSQIAVLWGVEGLFLDSVELFLKAGAAWDVVKVPDECGVDFLLQRVKTVKPTVVVLCQERDASDVALLMQLAQIQSCLKVVAISMESNLMQIYSKQRVIMHNVSDLLSIVNHE